LWNLREVEVEEDLAGKKRRLETGAVNSSEKQVILLFHPFDAFHESRMRFDSVAST
jgi:hypothetical protein